MTSRERIDKYPDAFSNSHWYPKAIGKCVDSYVRNQMLRTLDALLYGIPGEFMLLWLTGNVCAMHITQTDPLAEALRYKGHEKWQ
jgi:hypothetical protein